ncbi:MAG: LptA/OstA family protein, partial [Deltaproteobacteria bacterium]
NFDKATGVVRLTDNVRAVTDGGLQLNTDVLDWSQTDRAISTDDTVEVKRDNLTAVGKGLEAKPDAKIAKFEKDVILTLEQEKAAPAPPRESPEASPKALEQPFGGAGKLIITCDGPMELNYDKQVAIFHDNVKVDSESGQGTMIADVMTVRFDSATRQIDRIEAEGNVQIKRQDNVSYSDGAVFTNAERKVVLTGRPKLVLFTEQNGAAADISVVAESIGGAAP